MTASLLTEVSDGIAVLTFNNPAKRNALTREMRAALPGRLGELNADAGVRVVIVTGAGSRAFTAGADISEFAEQRTSPDARAEYDRGQAAIGHAWASLEKPVIAMIRGFCLGGGLLTALQADIRLAAEDSQFGIPAARLGLGYGFTAVTTLMAVIGPAWTSEVLLSARRFTAAEALQMGLVNRVLPAGQLAGETMSLARAIAQNAPLTVAACKAAIQAAATSPGQPATARVEAMIEACFQSADYREGQRAFAEKRPPAFTGR
ncbi:MAG TPA: enoyl-CoA hydratase [Streptosporangiaceae bacterium]|nr:enoyl-CoA hydratase [Streptosporangiaceae bacterium]